MSKKHRLTFETVICIEGGEAYGHRFEEGEIYPVLGNNNGIQIAYTNAIGDAQILLCHSWTGKPGSKHEYGIQAPVGLYSGEDEEWDRKFADQDGTIPPLFAEYHIDKTKEKKR